MPSLITRLGCLAFPVNMRLSRPDSGFCAYKDRAPYKPKEFESIPVMRERTVW
jgi:hypothetical protein